MDSFAWLHAGLAVAGAALASIAVWSRRRPFWKTVAVGLLCALVAIGYFSHAALLSRPKPLSLEMGGLEGARVLSAALREDEAIYLWLAVEETPRFYAMPWDTGVAQRLQAVMRETGRSGHDVIIRPADAAAAPGKAREGAPEVHTFYAVPPPLLLPEKRLHGLRGLRGEM